MKACFGQSDCMAVVSTFIFSIVVGKCGFTDCPDSRMNIPTKIFHQPVYLKRR